MYRYIIKDKSIDIGRKKTELLPKIKEAIGLELNFDFGKTRIFIFSVEIL